MNYSHGNHPNLYDRIMKGREHETMGDYRYRPAGEMQEGDGFHWDGRSYVVSSRREHKHGITFISRPRANFVNHELVSRLQFGVPGITLDEPEEHAHTFDPHQVVPIRD